MGKAAAKIPKSGGPQADGEPISPDPCELPQLPPPPAVTVLLTHHGEATQNLVYKNTY